MIDARIAYRPGQRLDAGDLNTDAGIGDAMQAAHIRGLHHACGVVCGFGIAVAADGRSVTVSPGLAYDAGGRELLLLDAVVLAVPAWQPQGAGKAYAAGIEIYRAANEARAAVRWTLSLDPTRVTCGGSVRRLLLGVLRIDGPGTIGGAPSYARRPVARTGRRPDIVSGSVAWSDLVWQHRGLTSSARVDTSKADFAAAPIYFVRFASEPPPQLNPSGGAGVVLLSASDPKPAGFKLNATLVVGGFHREQLRGSYTAALIEWTAIESLDGRCIDSTGGCR